MAFRSVSITGDGTELTAISGTSTEENVVYSILFYNPNGADASATVKVNGTIVFTETIATGATLAVADKINLGASTDLSVVLDSGVVATISYMISAVDIVTATDNVQGILDIKDDIITVADNTSNINTVVTNMPAIQDAYGNAQIAQSSANYKGDWVSDYNSGNGYAIGDTISYTDEYFYISKIASNTSTPSLISSDWMVVTGGNAFVYSTVTADKTVNAKEYSFVDTESIAQVDTISGIVVVDSTDYAVTINGTDYTYTSTTPVAQVDTVVVGTAVDGDVYAVDVDGTVYSYTAGTDSTVGSIGDGIADLISNGESDGNGNVTITAVTAGVPQTVVIDSSTTNTDNISTSTTTDNVPPDTVQDIINGILDAISDDNVTATDSGSSTILLTANTAGTAFTVSVNGNMQVVVTVENKVGPITITLPSTPLENSVIGFLDFKGMFDTNALTILRNGKLIMGLAEDMVVDTKNISFELIYINGDWRIK